MVGQPLPHKFRQSHVSKVINLIHFLPKFQTRDSDTQGLMLTHIYVPTGELIGVGNNPVSILGFNMNSQTLDHGTQGLTSTHISVPTRELGRQL